MKQLAALTMAMLMAAPVTAETGASEIVCGCSGGVTGGSSGVTVTRAGSIIRWQTDVAGGDPKETPLRTDLAEAQSLFTELEKMRFETIEYNKPGNMTCFVTRRIGTKRHSVAWRLGDESAPEPVLKLYQRVRSLESSPTK